MHLPFSPLRRSASFHFKPNVFLFSVFLCSPRVNVCLPRNCVPLFAGVFFFFFLFLCRKRFRVSGPPFCVCEERHCLLLLFFPPLMWATSPVRPHEFGFFAPITFTVLSHSHVRFCVEVPLSTTFSARKMSPSVLVYVC